MHLHMDSDVKELEAKHSDFFEVDQNIR